MRDETLLVCTRKGKLLVPGRRWNKLRGKSNLVLGVPRTNFLLQLIFCSPWGVWASQWPFSARFLTCLGSGHSQHWCCLQAACSSAAAMSSWCPAEWSAQRWGARPARGERLSSRYRWTRHKWPRPRWGSLHCSQSKPEEDEYLLSVFCMKVSKAKNVDYLKRIFTSHKKIIQS